MIPSDADQKRKVFFQLVFGGAEGLLCLTVKQPGSKGMEEFWFRYPTDIQLLLDRISTVMTGNNVYFCPQLFKERKRQKPYVVSCPNLWSDLDACAPENMRIEPTIAMESSPGRYQALWVLDRPANPEDAEEYSRRIAYYHYEEGADRSGWDLTQLLRVPYTYNYKYDNSKDEVPYVKIIKANKNKYALEAFDDYPQAEGYEVIDIPFPDTTGMVADDILERYGKVLPAMIWPLYQNIPDSKSWSESLWKLEMSLLEAGLSREETFVVAREAACNKYRRDDRSEGQLWKEVCRADTKIIVRQQKLIAAEVELPDLITDEEKELVETSVGFVGRYIKWAKSLGDAAWEYHQAGAFIILSSLLSGSVRLPTSFGTITPNLWFMILADTTLTRKSTAMDIATDLLLEVDDDAILATDGSIEGLMTSLSTRPGRPSVFLRDEFSGLLEAITKKDYLAGMAETLTKLYDGRMQKRILRKEVIEVRDPVLITFAGGIRTRIQELLRVDDVTSGFIPRFVFITAESNVSNRRALGPPTQVNLGDRDAILEELRAIYIHYNAAQQTVVQDGKIIQASKRQWQAQLTPEAWDRYNLFEETMVKSAIDAVRPDLLMPVFDRLSKSALKASVLIACARQRKESVVVDLEDILQAIYYAVQWREHVISIVNNVGQSASERMLGRILAAVHRRDGQMPRSAIMQAFHLNSRETDLALSTLDQRGLITTTKMGRGQMVMTTTKETKYNHVERTRGLQ